MEKYRVEEAIPVPLSRSLGGGRNKENKTKSKFLIKRKSPKIKVLLPFLNGFRITMQEMPKSTSSHSRERRKQYGKIWVYWIFFRCHQFIYQVPPKGVKSLCPYSFPFPWAKKVNKSNYWPTLSCNLSHSFQTLAYISTEESVYSITWSNKIRVTLFFVYHQHTHPGQHLLSIFSRHWRP